LKNRFSVLEKIINGKCPDYDEKKLNILPLGKSFYLGSIILVASCNATIEFPLRRSR